MWRKGWYEGNKEEEESEKRVCLCNACGLLWKRGWFCEHCLTVYRKDGKDQRQKEPSRCPWISCDYCDNFSHYECEKERGAGENVLEQKYYACPQCRLKESLGEPREEMMTTNAKESSAVSSHAGMRMIGKRVVFERPFLRESKSSTKNTKKAQKFITATPPPPIGVGQKNLPEKSRRQSILSAKNKPAESNATKATAAKSAAAAASNKTGTTNAMEKLRGVPNKIPSRNLKKNTSTTNDNKEQNLGPSLDGAFAVWPSMRAPIVPPSEKTQIALQKAKSCLNGDKISLNLIDLKRDCVETKNHVALPLSFVFGKLDDDGDDEEKLSTAALDELIFIEDVDSAALATQNLKSAREFLENDIEAFFALRLKQTLQGSDEIDTETGKPKILLDSLQQHAFKPILNCRNALQKISSFKLTKSLGADSIKIKNEIIESSQIRETLQKIRNEFGNGKEIFESLKAKGGFWASEYFLDDIELVVQPVSSLSPPAAELDSSKKNRLSSEIGTVTRSKTFERSLSPEPTRAHVSGTNSKAGTLSCPTPERIKRPKLMHSGGFHTESDIKQMVPNLAVKALLPLPIQQPPPLKNLLPPLPEPECFAEEYETYDDGANTMKCGVGTQHGGLYGQNLSPDFFNLLFHDEPMNEDRLLG
jgi:hypothetical protein